MAEVRLTTDIWLSALRMRLESAAVPFYILARGDSTAGAVALVAVRRDGAAALWVREYDFDADARIWRATLHGTEAEVSAAARRQRDFDPDLWIVEVETDDPTRYLAGMG